MKKLLSIIMLMSGVLTSPLTYGQIPADIQAKVDSAKTALAALGSDAAVVSAVKESNAKGGLVAGMSNAKWDELADNDAVVNGFANSAASKVIKAFATKHSELNKLYLRDEKGNLVAMGSGGKPLLWNIASRPFYKPAMDGKAWSDSAVKPDATTQVKGVLFAVPVMDGGKAIGLLQSNVSAN